MKKIISSLALIPIVLFTISINNSVAQWVPTSGPGGGRINCFGVSGSNIFAGVFGRGVYRSTNSGMSWTAVNNGITNNTSITCLSANGLNIFAGSGGGIFYSSNNGDNWVPRNNGLTNQEVWSIAVLGNYTFAGTAGGGIFRSANNGESWTTVNNGLTILSVYSFSVNGNNLFAGTEYGVYLSTNNGESWNAVNNGLPNLFVLSFVLSGTNLFTVLYSGGVFVSSNNGESWTAANNGLPNLYVNTIASNGNDLFVGTLYSGIYYSNNNGGSWTAFNNGLTSQAINALAISGTNIFAGTDANGVFRSTNNGNNWTTVNSGLTCLYVDALTSNGTNIFASVWKDLGYYGSGVFKTSNNGDSWTELNNCFSYYQVQYLFSNETIMLAGTAGTEGGVFRSTDTGDSWSSTGLNSICSFLSCGNNVFAGTWAGIFLSSNNGDSWNYAGLTNLSVTALTSIGSNIFAGTNTGVFQSSNNGESWTAKGLSTKYINALTASGNNIFAGTSNDPVGTGGVYLSTNYGTSWTTVNNGLTNLDVRSIISIGTNIVAGTGAGIYLSTNNGTNWINKNQGFENLPYVGLSSNLLNANNYIFAGISDFSVWKREMIDGYLIVTSPNGGENYIPGTTQNITWNSFGVQNVKIELTTNNGGTWSTISPSYPAASGSYTWTVPNYNSANCKTRISDVLNSGINDISDNTFIVSIYSLNLGLIAYYPFESNADDMSGNGKHGTIMNQCEFVNGQVGNGIKVFGSPNYLGSDGGHVLLPNMEFINNYSQFTISLWVKYENLNDRHGEGYVFFGDHNSGFIGISNFSDSISFNSSNYDGFNIAASNDEKNIFVYYSLVYDNGTLKGYRNGQLLKTITCTYTPNIYGSFSGVGAHSWYGCNCAGSTRFTGIFDELRLYNRALTSSEIQQLFNQAPNIALNFPNGGESFTGGSTQNISWNSNDVQNVKIELTTNYGVNWNLIVNSVNASGSTFSWLVPNISSTNCKIKITSLENSSLYGTSNSSFTIQKGNLANMPSVSLSPAQINAGGSVSITGKDFKPNSYARIIIVSPESQIVYEQTVNASGSGMFTASYSSLANSSAGIYTCNVIDTINNQNPSPKIFDILGAVSSYNLTITSPMYDSVGSILDVEWRDKMVPGPEYPVSNIKRYYKYSVEYSLDNGVNWIQSGISEGYQNINSTQLFNRQIDLSSVINQKISAKSNDKITCKVTDLNKTSRKSQSNSLPVKYNNLTHATVYKLWDHSYPQTSSSQVLGVCSDGVSRIYLKISKKPGSFPITSVSLRLFDEQNNTTTNLLGKLKIATVTNSYSDEANTADATSLIISNPQDDNWVWYVSPDDFSLGDLNDIRGERTVKVEVTVNYSQGIPESTIEDIKIIRPLLMFVHGLGGNPLGWNNFAYKVGGNKKTFMGIESESTFKFRKAPEMLKSASFEENAHRLLNIDNLPGITNSNSFIYSIESVRKKGYACNQVYYVCHSMGGSVIRAASEIPFYYSELGYKSQYNYGKGFANRIITIDSPHNGSPLADLARNIALLLTFTNNSPLPFYLHLPVTMLIKKYVLDSDFLKTFFVKQGGIIIPTSAVINLQSNGLGKYNFKQTNIPSFLIAGDLIPGTASNMDDINWNFSFDKNFNDLISMFYEFLPYTKYLIVRDIFYRPEDLGLVKKIMDDYPLYNNLKQKPVFELINLISKKLSSEQNFFPNSDFVVSVNSQLAGKPRTIDNTFDRFNPDDPNSFGIGHALLYSCTDAISIGTKVFHLLNTKLPGNVFMESIPATPVTAYKNNSGLSSGSDNKSGTGDSLKTVNIIAPFDGEVVFADSILSVSYNITDTTNLKYITVSFQDESYSDTVKSFTHNLNLVVSGNSLDTNLIYISATYINADTLRISTDLRSVVVKTYSSPVAFSAGSQSFFIMKNEIAAPTYKTVFSNFIYEGPYSAISAVVSNPSVVTFDNTNKTFNALSSGETYALVSVNGITDTLFFIVAGEILVPGIVNLVNPADSSVQSSGDIHFNWNRSSSAFSYHIQVSDNPVFNNIVFENSNVMDTIQTIAQLNDSGTYFWRVKALNSSSSGEWSNIRTFKTGNQFPQAPVLLHPANSSAHQPLTQAFRWKKSYIQSDNQLKVRTKTEKIQKELKSDLNIKETKDLPISKEKVFVDKTNKTLYKEESQTDNISNYWFELVRDTVSMSNLLRDSVLADTVKLVSSLENLKDYYWRVKAKNEIGWGNFSAWSKFTTISPPDFSHSAVPPSGSNSTTTFGATDLTFNANVSIPANVTVAYYSVPPVSGELPAGILSVSQYYWIIQDLGIEFSDGLFKIPLSAIGGVSDPSKLVFLKRSNAGDNWINIGGVIQDGYLVNTIPFTSFSEFAIASQDAQPLQNSYISITVIPQGFYDAVLNRLNMRDTVTALLRSVDSPYSLIDSARGVIDSLTFTIKFGFKIAPTGTYYIVIKHRNSIETWCKSGGIAFTKYATINYDFTSSIMQAYGDNMILKGSRVCIYSGDINQDGSVDASDRSSTWNDRNKTGYEASDVDGSGVVDANDRSMVWNNRNLITEKPALDNFNMKHKNDKRDKEIKNTDIKGKDIKKDKQSDNELKLDGSKKKSDSSNTKNDGSKKSDGSNSQKKNKSK